MRDGRKNNPLDEREDHALQAKTSEQGAMDRTSRMSRLLENADFIAWLYDLFTVNGAFYSYASAGELTAGRAVVMDDIKYEISRTSNGAKILGELTEKHWAQGKE